MLWTKGTGGHPEPETYELLSCSQELGQLASNCLFGLLCSQSAEPACLLTQLLAMTTTHKFSPLVGVEHDDGVGQSIRRVSVSQALVVAAFEEKIHEKFM